MFQVPLIINLYVIVIVNIDCKPYGWSHREGTREGGSVSDSRGSAVCGVSDEDGGQDIISSGCCCSILYSDTTCRIPGRGGSSIDVP